jgi:nucleotide-binding universal stress UspA family protein
MALMFRRIIVTTDLSADSYTFTNSLQNLRAFGAQECLLLQCLNVHEAAGFSLPYFTSIIEKNLERQKQTLEQMGYSAETRIISGSLKNELNQIAVNEDYSLIVVGAKIQSLAGGVLFGETAYKVIRCAKKPVLLLRPDDRRPEQPRENPNDNSIWDHVLFPVDFSGNTVPALDYISEMAAAGIKKVTLLHVIDMSRNRRDLFIRPEDLERIDEGLRNIKKLLQSKSDIPVDMLMIQGYPAAEIIKAAGSLNASLIVMENRRRGLLRELFTGSLNSRVAHHARSAVLLIPAEHENSINLLHRC